MSKKQKKMLVRILISAALMIVLNFVPVQGYGRFILYLIPYLIIGYDILIKAFKGIKNRQPFELFRGNRRSRQCRRADQRFQLYGDTGSDKIRGF